MHFQFLKYIFPNSFDLQWRYSALFALLFKIPLVNTLSEIHFSKFPRFPVLPRATKKRIQRRSFDSSRWKARKRQRRGFFRDVVGRPGAEFSTLVGVIAAGEPRQRGDRRLLHPRPTGRSPKGVVHNVERGAPGDQVEQQSGDVEEHRCPVHAEHHEHRWCGFEVRESWLLGRNWPRMILIRATVLVFERNIWDSSFTLPRESSATYRGAFTLISRHSIARC